MDRYAAYHPVEMVESNVSLALLIKIIILETERKPSIKIETK